MLRITVGLSALALAILVSPLAVATPIQWTGLGSNGHYYELVPGSVNWSQALGVAAAHGGHLPTFASAAEESFVNLTFFGGPTGDYWLDLADEDIEGTFVWLTGEPLIYTNWLPGEPNNLCCLPGPEDYGHWSHLGGWNDANPFNDYPQTIVEYDSTPIPEPGSLFLLLTGALCLRNRYNGRSATSEMRAR